MAVSQDLALLVVNGEHRLDSRVLAQHLGYEQKVVLQSIRRHKARLEAKSVLLRFEAKPLKGSSGGRPETYYLLNERQCLILAGSLKKGEEALIWHDHLVDAFLQAREQVRQLERQREMPTPVRLRPISDTLRPRFLVNRHAPGPGWWSVVAETYRMSYHLEGAGLTLPAESMIDISIGRRWSAFAREKLGLHEEEIGTYLCMNPETGRTYTAKKYPDSYRYCFETWLEEIYLPEHAPAYRKQAVRYAEQKLIKMLEKVQPRKVTAK